MMVNTHQQKLLSALWQLQQSSSFCDTVVVGRGNVEIRAHAAVLAAASSQLCFLLQASQVENTVHCGMYSYRLDVVDYDMSIVVDLLRYIYTGEMTALHSPDGTSRNALVALCSQFGITTDDSSFDMELHG